LQTINFLELYKTQEVIFGDSKHESLATVHEFKPKRQDGKPKHHVQKKTNITQQNYKVKKNSNHQK
jgi:hypothetical protein